MLKENAKFATKDRKKSKYLSNTKIKALEKLNTPLKRILFNNEDQNLNLIYNKNSLKEEQTFKDNLDFIDNRKNTDNTNKKFQTQTRKEIKSDLQNLYKLQIMSSLKSKNSNFSSEEENDPNILKAGNKLNSYTNSDHSSKR